MISSQMVKAVGCQGSSRADLVTWVRTVRAVLMSGQPCMVQPDIHFSIPYLAQVRYPRICLLHLNDGSSWSRLPALDVKLSLHVRKSMHSSRAYSTVPFQRPRYCRAANIDLIYRPPHKLLRKRLIDLAIALAVTPSHRATDRSRITKLNGSPMRYITP